jgi:hypothetical protein
MAWKIVEAAPTAAASLLLTERSTMTRRILRAVGKALTTRSISVRYKSATASAGRRRRVARHKRPAQHPALQAPS